jgi:hypothetical protein
LCFPPALIHFWELNARLSFDISECGSTVPRKIDLNFCKRKRDERCLELIAEAPDSFLHLRTREWDLRRGLLVMKEQIRGFLSERK